MEAVLELIQVRGWRLSRCGIVRAHSLLELAGQFNASLVNLGDV